jgi:hypothetical protein
VLKYDIYYQGDDFAYNGRKLIKTVYVDELNVTTPADERFRA